MHLLLLLLLCVCVCVCGGPHNMPGTVAVDRVATHQLIMFMIYCFINYMSKIGEKC